MIDTSFIGLTILSEWYCRHAFLSQYLYVIKTRYELSASGNTTAATVHTIKDKNSDYKFVS